MLRLARAIRYFILLLIFSQVSLAEDTLEQIHNYHKVDPLLHTAGQVLQEHVPGLTRAGIQLVVNLAPASEKRNREEGFLLTSEGISYVQIPVKWDEPNDEDLQLFFSLMEARSNRVTLVHCFANYRASAFTYLYRVLIEGVDESSAKEDLHRVWTDEAFEEAPQWRTFIDRHLQNTELRSS